MKNAYNVILALEKFLNNHETTIHEIQYLVMLS